MLRGPAPAPGFSGLAHALTTFKEMQHNLHRNDPRRFVLAADLEAAEQLVRDLAEAIAPLERLVGSQQSLFALAQAHANTLEALADERDVGISAYAGTDGRQLQRVFETIAESPSSRTLELAAAEYPEVFHLLCSRRAERRAETGNARVHIFGLLEARCRTTTASYWPGSMRAYGRPIRAAMLG